MDLLPAEKELMRSPGGKLVLTTHRVRYERQVIGAGVFTSIMLDELASCAVVRASYPLLLLLSLLAVVGGYYLGGGGSLMSGLVVGVLLVILYFYSRRQELALASAGATIRVRLVNMDMAAVKNMVEQIEAAKNARYFARSVETSHLSELAVHPQG
jgi:hypothetical protein